MKKIYTILGGILVIVLVFWLILHQMTKTLNMRISELEANLAHEKQATEKQLKEEKEISEKYKKQYEAFIKAGDFCYNKNVEDDVLKMLGEK
jgi:flagellar biosynthesis/type III secretory pathway M-ring protein FliF/YscJ